MSSGRFIPGRGPDKTRAKDAGVRTLAATYVQAHRLFEKGEFTRALEIYGGLALQLKHEAARLVRANYGPAVCDEKGQLAESAIQQLLVRSLPVRAKRLLGTGHQAKIANTCAAVFHDIALLARHIAEAAGTGRDGDAVDGITRSFAIALAVQPLSASTFHNLAGYEDYLGRDRDAIVHYEAALALNRTQAESWTALGHACARTGNRARAEICFAEALRLTEASRRRWDMSMLRLLKGDYVRGWEDYEGRWTFPPYIHGYGRPDLTAPAWDGSSIDGTLYLHGEQGAGDMMQMARYVPLVQARVGRLVVEVTTGLIRLFERMFPGVPIVDRGAAEKPAHDVQLPMFSLPFLFGTTLETVPPPAPFDAGLAPVARRVGLCWKGSSKHPNDHTRSMPFQACFPLLDLPGFEWQNLQQGVELEAPVLACPAGDFAETAAAIARCELVITVDTSVAHLAATMGVETWILLPVHAEWRWLQHRNDSPWYPQARLWRCERPGDWKTLIANVAQDLRARHTTEAAA